MCTQQGHLSSFCGTLFWSIYRAICAILQVVCIKRKAVCLPLVLMSWFAINSTCLDLTHHKKGMNLKHPLFFLFQMYGSVSMYWAILTQFQNMSYEKLCNASKIINSSPTNSTIKTFK